MRWLQRLLGLPHIEEVAISPAVIEDLCAMAQSSHPKEMLAFLAGPVKKGTLHINELQLQAYDASVDSAHVTLSNIPMTTSIVGTAHSHPGGSKRPSDADLHLFSKFGMVHMIIGEPYRPQDIRFYNKSGHKIAVRISSEGREDR